MVGCKGESEDARAVGWERDGAGSGESVEWGRRNCEFDNSKGNNDHGSPWYVPLTLLITITSGQYSVEL